MMIYVLLADGFEEVEALAPIDLLLRANQTVKTVSVMGRREVVGTHGITVTADLLPEEADEPPALLLLPGGMPGASHLNDSPVTDDMLVRTLKNDGRVAAICAAPYVLGVRGLLSGKRAVCFPGFEQYLEGAILAQDRVVTDGNITTAKGMGAAFELGLELVRLLTDEATAERIAASAFIADTPKKKTCRTGGSAACSSSAKDEAALLRPAIEVALEYGKISTSLLQRRLLIGFGKAARLIDRMEELGVVGEANGTHPREILWTAEQYTAACDSNKI